MPLSDEEQRLLEEMERSLYHNDADDVTTVGAPRGRANYTAIALGIIAGVVGIALLLVGVVSRLAPVGLIGFVVMFVGALLAIAPPRRLTVEHSAPSGTGAPRKRASFMDSLNERWERRSDDDPR
ncbi:spore wall synthesis complex protein [soil metagenome]